MAQITSESKSGSAIMKNKLLAIIFFAVLTAAFAWRLTWSDEKAFMIDCHNEGRSLLECQISWKAELKKKGSAQ